jgi:DNA-binding transcriptional regulator YdaS (Cro superfamily)
MISPSVTDASARAAPMIDQTNRGQVSGLEQRPASPAQAN